MTTIDFNTYTNSYKREKGSANSITNTRITGGSYSIPDLDYAAWLNRYCKEIVETGSLDYFTETQLTSDGPILVDLDFRFPYGTKQRHYTKDHIDDLVGAYIDDISHMFQLNEGSIYQIFVLEKPH